MSPVVSSEVMPGEGFLLEYHDKASKKQFSYDKNPQKKKELICATTCSYFSMPVKVKLCAA
jgi:hypothetical protein